MRRAFLIALLGLLSRDVAMADDWVVDRHDTLVVTTDFSRTYIARRTGGIMRQELPAGGLESVADYPTGLYSLMFVEYSQIFDDAHLEACRQGLTCGPISLSVPYLDDTTAVVAATWPTPDVEVHYHYVFRRHQPSYDVRVTRWLKRDLTLTNAQQCIMQNPRTSPEFVGVDADNDTVLLSSGWQRVAGIAPNRYIDDYKTSLFSMEDADRATRSPAMYNDLANGRSFGYVIPWTSPNMRRTVTGHGGGAESTYAFAEYQVDLFGRSDQEIARWPAGTRYSVALQYCTPAGSWSAADSLIRAAYIRGGTIRRTLPRLISASPGRSAGSITKLPGYSQWDHPTFTSNGAMLGAIYRFRQVALAGTYNRHMQPGLCEFRVMAARGGVRYDATPLDTLTPISDVHRVDSTSEGVWGVEGYPLKTASGVAWGRSELAFGAETTSFDWKARGWLTSPDGQPIDSAWADFPIMPRVSRHVDGPLGVDLYTSDPAFDEVGMRLGEWPSALGTSWLAETTVSHSVRTITPILRVYFARATQDTVRFAWRGRPFASAQDSSADVGPEAYTPALSYLDRPRALPAFTHDDSCGYYFSEGWTPISAARGRVGSDTLWTVRAFWPPDYDRRLDRTARLWYRGAPIRTVRLEGGVLRHWSYDASSGELVLDPAPYSFDDGTATFTLEHSAATDSTLPLARTKPVSAMIWDGVGPIQVHLQRHVAQSYSYRLTSLLGTPALSGSTSSTLDGTLRLPVSLNLSARLGQGLYLLDVLGGDGDRARARILFKRD